LRLERNYAESAQLLQARLAQFSYDSRVDRAYDQVALSLSQRLAGDLAGSKVTAGQARNTLEQFYRDQPDSAWSATALSQAYLAFGEKESAVKLAEHAIMLADKDSEFRCMHEEAFVLVQMTFGENSRAISTLTRLLKTPYNGWFCGPAPIIPALLRLDPIWDPLRADPAFQKLCEETQK
jgi:predicted Zn-dependent protease